MMQSRRSFVRSVATATAFPMNTVTADMGNCGFCQSDTTELVDDDPSFLSNEPSFTVKSTQKTHDEYWKPRAYFEEHEDFTGGTWAHGEINGNYIVLNESLSDNITTTIVAHEVGHNLGYGHTTGSIMAPQIIGMTDAVDTTPLSDTTIGIFEQLSCATLCYWDQSSALNDVLKILSLYNNSIMDKNSVLHAISQYNERHVSDAYYVHEWGGFGDERGVSQSGEFYRWTT